MASGGPTSGENRLKSYKTKGLTLEESRRKREEEGVQLRKSKRDEQVEHTSDFNTYIKSHYIHYLSYNFDACLSLGFNHA